MPRWRRDLHDYALSHALRDQMGAMGRGGPRHPRRPARHRPPLAIESGPNRPTGRAAWLRAVERGTRRGGQSSVATRRRGQRLVGALPAATRRPASLRYTPDSDSPERKFRHDAAFRTHRGMNPADVAIGLTVGAGSVATVLLVDFVGGVIKRRPEVESRPTFTPVGANPRHREQWRRRR